MFWLQQPREAIISPLFTFSSVWTTLPAFLVLFPVVFVVFLFVYFFVFWSWPLFFRGFLNVFLCSLAILAIYPQPPTFPPPSPVRGEGAKTGKIAVKRQRTAVSSKIDWRRRKIWVPAGGRGGGGEGRLRNYGFSCLSKFLEWIFKKVKLFFPQIYFTQFRFAAAFWKICSHVKLRENGRCFWGI